jgi:hypothetical protein
VPRIAVAATIALVVSACQPPPPSLSPSAPPEPGPSAAAGAWTPIDLPGAAGVWFANGVIADADGFTVFGDINDRPAAWASPDGATWSSNALPGRSGFPSSGAASQAATVLIGGGSTDRCAHPFGQSLWRRARADATWQAVPFNQELFCAGGFENIAAFADAFAVVGTGTGDQPFAWQSSDGLAWRDAGQGLPFDAPPWLLAATDGGFIELGRGARTDVRVSVDGKAWSAVEAPPVPPAFNGDAPGMSPVALLATAQGVAAFYQSDGATTRSAWLRHADRSWSEIELEGFERGDVLTIGVTIDGTPILFGGRGRSARLWISPDLARWTAVPLPDVEAVLGLASFADRLVLVTKIPATGDPNVTRVYGAPAAVLGL